MIKITADFQSSQNYLMEFLLLDIADLIFQSSYWISCLTVKNHVVEKTGLGSRIQNGNSSIKPAVLIKRRADGIHWKHHILFYPQLDQRENCQNIEQMLFTYFFFLSNYTLTGLFSIIRACSRHFLSSHCAL